jgi:ABC-type nitrate/sulfonate/bicarbonate transport system substrate-binding protein
MNHLFRRLATITSLALLAGSPLIAAQAAETAILRYQASSVGQIAYAELADALGYLAPVKLERVGIQQGGPGGLQLTATGQTDFAQSFNGSIINAVVAGAKLKSVAAYLATSKDDSVGAWVLDGSAIRTPRDLIGKKVGVNTLGALWDAAVETYLKKGGLNEQEIKQVTLVPIPAANVEQALRQGQLDVALLSAGFQTQAVERGGIRRLFDDYSLFGNVNLASIVMSPEFIEKNPQTTRQFVTAVARAIEWLKEHKRDEAVAIYGKYLETHGQAGALNGLKYWQGQSVATKGGLIENEDFARWISWQQSRSGKSLPLNVADLYTNAFNPYAAR